MPLTKGKHIVEEINGIRCSVVEKGASADRVAFLKKLLEFNHYEVQVLEEPKPAEDPQAPATFTIGVTDLIFNPVIAVYEMSLRTPDGRKFSAAYWNQITEKTDTRYWVFRKK